MTNEELIEAYKRELAGAIARGRRDRVVLIEAELKALGVTVKTEAAGSGSATKRVRKAAS